MTMPVMARNNGHHESLQAMSEPADHPGMSIDVTELSRSPRLTAMEVWTAWVGKLMAQAATCATDQRTRATLEGAAADAQALREALAAANTGWLEPGQTAVVSSIYELWDANVARFEALAASVDPEWHGMWQERSVGARPTSRHKTRSASVDLVRWRSAPDRWKRCLASVSDELEVPAAGYIPCAEGHEVFGGPLHVEQPTAVAVAAEQLGESDERHLRGVPSMVEHGLTSEDPTDGHAVQPAREPVLVPGLHAVCPPELVQDAVGAADLGADPPPWAYRIGAG
jgi:hypothetical protein